MKRLFSQLLVIGLVFFMSSAFAASTDLSELERRLERQERRIDRLEQTIENLQNSLYDTQYDNPVDVGSSRAPKRSSIDPLIGTWECTNNVFNYDISFFADGRIIQEEPFFSKTKSGHWSRLNDSQFTTEQGQLFQADLLSNDEISVTDLRNQTVWECVRKP